MPIYTFKNKETGETFDVTMKISEREEYKKQNPHLEAVLYAPDIISGVSMKSKESGGFRETMAKISEAHPGSTLADEYGKKTSKEVKTKEVLKKHGVI